MAADRLRDLMLPNAFSNVLSDIADLFQKGVAACEGRALVKASDQIARRRLDARRGCAALARRRGL